MKNDEINYKNLTKYQLQQLKGIYIESRINKMTHEELKNFVKEVLDLQVNGTVGGDEEREVWKEMKDHFKDDFEIKLQHVINTNKNQEIINPEQEEFLERLKILENRKNEEKETNTDMW